MRYKQTFKIFETLEQAKKFINSRKGENTLTPWSSEDGQEKCFIVWYYI